MEWRPFILAIALVAVAGCIQPQPNQTTPTPVATPSRNNEQATCTPPTVDPSSSSGSVANYPGSFSYSDQPKAKTAKETYAWQDPSGAANIEWNVQGVSGSVTLKLVDACGKTMYENTRNGPSSQSGTSENTPRGRAGGWMIELDYQLFTGQMSLQISSS